MRLTGLEPIVFPDSEFLLLGTFPSVKSLEKREYYGNPVNTFWRILSGALAVTPVPGTYAEKKRMLRAHRIALWDVFASCERKGSGDKAIQDFRVNSIPLFLKKHRTIRKVLVESRTAEKIWQKHFEALTPVPGVYVPSPSTLARLPVPEKIRRWARELKSR